MTPAAAQTTTLVSTKGQVILPKAIREQQHWHAGTRLVVENTPRGVLLKAATLFAPSSVENVFGSLAHKGKALSVDEMNAAVAAEAKRHAGD
jgi:AbrB family looped-hinge helix DNA binding protein